MKRSAVFLAFTCILAAPSASAEIAEIENASWQEIPNTAPTESADAQFSTPTYIDINSIVRNENLIIFDVVNPDASYGRVEANCITNQIRSLRFGYFQSVTQIVYEEYDETWIAATLYQSKLLKFACDSFPQSTSR